MRFWRGCDGFDLALPGQSFIKHVEEMCGKRRFGIGQFRVLAFCQVFLIWLLRMTKTA